MEAAKHDVFAHQTIGGKTLLEMTRHNEQAFANRLSPSGCLDKFFMPYAWLTCQQVSPVIVSHNPMVTLSVCVPNPLRAHNTDTLLNKPRLRLLAKNHWTS